MVVAYQGQYEAFLVLLEPLQSILLIDRAINDALDLALPHISQYCFYLTLSRERLCNLERKLVAALLVLRIAGLVKS